MECVTHCKWNEILSKVYSLEQYEKFINYIEITFNSISRPLHTVAISV